MDSLTHIVLGACIGEVVAGKQLGKKALLIGAVANSIPDIDFVASFWLPTSTDLLAHRGFTHSLLFVVLLAPVLAIVSKKASNNKDIPKLLSTKHWLIFWGVELFVHLFIDCFNVYGTGLFEPFSHYRVSFNTIYVADPLFSIAPMIGLVWLLILKKSSNKRKVVAFTAIVSCSLYLLLATSVKLNINSTVERSLQLQNISANNYFTTPTLFNCLLWYVVAGNDSGYFTGYRSVFDKGEHIKYRFVYKNDSLLRGSGIKADIDLLKRFSQGFYSVDYRHDSLVFQDIRFGEITGWQNPHPMFAFYYFLQYPAANKLIIQRGRVAGWNKKMIASFLKRIGGDQ